MIGKESLALSGEDSPIANLIVMGVFAEFERALIRERQREGIAVARQRGACRGLAAIYRQWTASLTECLREAQAQSELPAGKDLGQVSAALIDAFEAAVTRAKVERSRSPFDSFEGFCPPLWPERFSR